MNFAEFSSPPVELLQVESLFEWVDVDSLSKLEWGLRTLEKDGTCRLFGELNWVSFVI